MDRRRLQPIGTTARQLGTVQQPGGHAALKAYSTRPTPRLGRRRWTHPTVMVAQMPMIPTSRAPRAEYVNHPVDGAGRRVPTSTRQPAARWACLRRPHLPPSPEPLRSRFVPGGARSVPPGTIMTRSNHMSAGVKVVLEAQGPPALPGTQAGAGGPDPGDPGRARGRHVDLRVSRPGHRAGPAEFRSASPRWPGCSPSSFPVPPATSGCTASRRRWPRRGWPRFRAYSRRVQMIFQDPFAS